MTASRANQGPRVAQANRRALIAAARALFSERGVDVPLVEIGRRAGVGQGSLYRHFPDRTSIVFAVFEENMTQLEESFSQPGASLRRFGDEVTHLTEGIAALLPLVTSSPEDPRLAELESRMRTLLDTLRAHAQDAGRLRADVTVDDLMTAVSMVAALMAATPGHLRHERATHAWDVLSRGLETH